MADYPGLPADNQPQPPPNIALNNVQVNRVRNLLARLPVRGQFYNIRFNSNQFPKWRFTKSLNNNNVLKNHFQAIQRLRDGQYFAITGGDSTQDYAILIIAKMESYLQKGMDVKNKIGSNRTFSRSPQVDKIKKLFHLNKDLPTYWHAGGTGLCGDILAVALEDTTNNKSRIRFYNLTQPLQVFDYKIDIVRNNVKAGACALGRLKSGHYLCVVWIDDKVSQPYFQFYRSLSTKIEDGFNQTGPILRHNQITGLTNNNVKDNKYQTIQLIQETNGQWYLICIGNLSNAAPTINDLNYVLSLKLNFNKSNFSNFKLKYSIHRKLDSHDAHSNFDAGAGIYVSNPNEMSLHSIYHWRDSDKLKLSEYQTIDDRLQLVTQAKKNQFVELYSLPNYKGDCMHLYANEIKSITDYRRLSVGNIKFNDKAQSIRYRLASGNKYELYEHRNYRGNHITLLGNGKIKLIPDLNDPNSPGLKDKLPFAKHISSSRIVT